MFEDSILSIEEDELRVELDKKSLFALASDTRVEILRALQPMRRTVSQLSETLNIDKAAVHRHLKKMEEGGLVQRFEDHGFVYYGLSWKARDLLMPNENTKIVVLLSATWILVGLIGFLLVMAFVATSTGQYGEKQASPAQPDFEQELISGGHSGFTLLGWTLLFCLGAVAAIAGVVGLRKFARPRQSSPEKAKGVEGVREVIGDD